jgi:soluble lytic murein transglycosylase-like protein
MWVLAWILLFAILLVPVCLVFAAELPHQANRYRAELTREAHQAWGLEAPVATFAAQVHQESRWQPDAVSRVGAQGMAQVMPSTARWWCEINGLSPQACQPSNPAWALRALVGYDRWLWDRLARSGPPCLRMVATLRGYNGGVGYVQREQRTGQPCEAFRAGWACRENLAYPQRIVNELEPIYERAGWGGGSCD